MKVRLEKLTITPEYFLRKCGYIEITNPHKNDEVSYAHSIHSGRFYPRFHIYIQKTGPDTFLNLHLDAKKQSYEGTTAHSGEYEGEVVEKEAARIREKAEAFKTQSTGQLLGFKTQESLWEKIKKIFK